MDLNDKMIEFCKFLKVIDIYKSFPGREPDWYLVNEPLEENDGK